MCHIFPQHVQVIIYGMKLFEIHFIYLYLQELEDFCFRFALNHMTAVTQTEAFSQLEECILKEFIRKAALSGAFRN